MTKSSGGDFLFRIIWGIAFATSITTAACLFLPEWIKDGSRHCGLFACCQSYRLCGFVNQEILQTTLPWIFVGWLLNVLVLFSAKCKCSNVLADSVRRAGTTAVISGIILLAGAVHFIVRMVATTKDLGFGPLGMVTFVVGITLISSGIFAFCYYPNTKSHKEDKDGLSHRRHKINEVEPFYDRTEGTSNIYNIPPPPDTEDTAFGRTTQVPLQSNTVPNNFARRFWKENVAVSKDPFTADVPYPTD